MGLKDHCQVAPEGPREAVKKRGTIHIHTTESRAWGSGECALRCAFEFHSSCSILPVTQPICVLSSSLTSPGKGRFVASPRLRCPRVKLTRRCRTLSPRRSSQQQWRSRLRSSAGASRPAWTWGAQIWSPTLCLPVSATTAFVTLELTVATRALLLPAAPASPPRWAPRRAAPPRSSQ